MARAVNVPVSSTHDVVPAAVGDALRQLIQHHLQQPNSQHASVADLQRCVDALGDQIDSGAKQLFLDGLKLTCEQAEHARRHALAETIATVAHEFLVPVLLADEVATQRPVTRLSPQLRRELTQKLLSVLKAAGPNGTSKKELALALKITQDRATSLLRSPQVASQVERIGQGRLTKYRLRQVVPTPGTVSH